MDKSSPNKETVKKKGEIMKTITTPTGTTMYALLEQGSIHTKWLSFEDANEMLERHTRFFPEIFWQIAPMTEVKDREYLKGFLERHRDAAVKYHQ